RKAIRSALEKGDATDRAFREKVYRQVFAALERSLEARRDVPEDDARRRREQIKAAIIDVERGFVSGGVNQAQPSPAAPSPDDRLSPDAPEADFVPRIEREERLH